MEAGLRRLPVYLLLDTSESMAGPAIKAVEESVRTLLSELRQNPLAIDTVHLSVITFGREAQHVVPLTELMKFEAPVLRVRTGTALGAALQVLSVSLENDVQKITTSVKGDYQPLVFILTDGQPTDDWESQADAINTLIRGKRANVFAIGCGPDVDTEVLYRITANVLVMPNLTPEAIRKSFVWLSASVKTVSAKVQEGPDMGLLGLPEPPADALRVAPRTSSSGNQAPRQVFLHAICSTRNQPYLMRFVRRSYEEQYDAVAAHELETLDDGAPGSASQISLELLCGVPACPYCNNPGAIVCPEPGCEVIFCSADEEAPEVICPKCHACLVKSGESGKTRKVKTSEG